MKRLFIILVFLLVFLFKSFAQDLCGTPAITNIENLRILSSPQKRSSNSNYILTVYFHVIRSSSGTGGVTTSNVTSAYNRLNQDFNSHGIYFNWNGIIDYINEDSYYNNNPDTCIFYLHNHINGIDIYLYPAIHNYNISYVGKAHGVGMNSEYLVVGNISGTPACMTSTISHEMGHVLNLWHTHHGTYNEGGNDNPCPELVNGSNSSTCGDYVEDTPADPKLSGKVNNNCVYTGTGTDANNQAYAPDVDLIMSYARNSCRTRFSSKQGERMRDAIENLPYLMNTRYYPIVSGPFIPCDNSVYSISNLSSSFTVTWGWQTPCGPILQQNTPSTNMSTLDKNGHGYINNTIVATIKKNGTTVCTLTKPINTSPNFSGNYSQAAHQYTNWYYPGTSNTSFGSGETIYLYRGSTITLTSSKFVGATLSYSGTTPLGWTHNGNTVSFHFSFRDINDPYSPRYIQNPASLTITGTYPSSCECFQFTVIGQLPQGYTLTSDGDSPDLDLNISSSSDQTYNVTCGATDGWELSVIDSSTGETIYRSHVDGTEKTLNTTGWKPGVYIIKATVGDQVQTQKLSVKK